MCWLRNVAKENMILINYHKMSPNDHEEVAPEEMDALMILMKAAKRSGYELKTSNTTEEAKEVKVAAEGTCDAVKITSPSRNNR